MFRLQKDLLSFEFFRLAFKPFSLIVHSSFLVIGRLHFLFCRWNWCLSKMVLRTWKILFVRITSFRKLNLISQKILKILCIVVVTENHFEFYKNEFIKGFKH